MQTRTILLLISVLFLACGKSDDLEAILSDNTFIAQRGGQAWKGTTEIGLTANDTLVFFAIGQGMDNGVMVAKIKFDGEGSYKLKNFQGTYYNTLGGDVLISRYAIGQGYEGEFSISAYDGEKRRVEGSFELQLKATRLYDPSKNDSTLTISKGRFKGSISERILQ